MKTRASYQNRNVAVLGLGSSGFAAARLLLEEGAKVTVLESAQGERLEANARELRAAGASVRLGEAAERDTTIYDLGVLSPGIDPAVPLVRGFRERNGAESLISELELSYTVCACPVIAITGTNGKTTTTELIERMLKACGVRTVAAGNIGPTFASFARRSDRFDVMTLEVSSFQLEAIKSFRPAVSVWLNFTPDHLDRYPSLDAYREAKLRMFENQTAEDWAVVNLREKPPLPAALEGRTITFSAYETGGDLDWHDGVIRFHGTPVLRLADTRLRGLHQVENLMAALAVGAVRGLDFAQMSEALASYAPLPHRTEPVATVDGVEYVNDSKATNLDALEKALLSETRGVVLIAGGKDKGFSYDPLTPLVAEKVRRVVLIGEMAGPIARSWGDKVPCETAASLKEAVEKARREARSGEVVLFSPGTSSYDMFSSYVDRGNQFRRCVEALPPLSPAP
ncbi:MAG TPA: UDP-N-acetylmuramoyl-L-alanine--D-glutamate ligase [Chthoniobacteraceae bacterium]|nr:UDP-N-acetylmuramoyl-L-alanine--D-glutamate ligase [Chthoniobacteraceae bacterium]